MDVPDRLKPTNNRPTIAVAVGIVVYELLVWAVDLLAASTLDPPTGVVTALTLLAIAVAAAVVGLVTQYVGDAPWAHSSHVQAVRAALKADPHELQAGDFEAAGLDPADLDRLDVPWDERPHFPDLGPQDET